MNTITNDTITTAETVRELRADLEGAKMRLQAGVMSYDECKRFATAAARALNAYGAAKAKLAGMRWKPVSAVGLMR